MFYYRKVHKNKKRCTRLFHRYNLLFPRRNPFLELQNYTIFRDFYTDSHLLQFTIALRYDILPR